MMAVTSVGVVVVCPVAPDPPSVSWWSVVPFDPAAPWSNSIAVGMTPLTTAS